MCYSREILMLQELMADYIHEEFNNRITSVWQVQGV